MIEFSVIGRALTRVSMISFNGHAALLPLVMVDKTNTILSCLQQVWNEWQTANKWYINFSAIARGSPFEGAKTSAFMKLR